MQLKEIINKSVWDKFVDSIPYKTPLMSWEWYEMEKSRGQNVFAVGLYEKEKLLAIIKYEYIKARRGPLLELRHGPIANYKALSFDALQALINALISLGKKHKSWLVRFQPYWPTDDVEVKNKFEKVGIKESTRHDTDAEMSLQIDLTQRLDDIFKSFRKTTRYEIRKANKTGVKVVIDEKGKYWSEFVNIYKDTVKRQKWGALSTNTLKQQFNFLSKYGMSKLFLAKYKGEFIAGAIFTFYKDFVMYHHSGSLTKYHRIPASYLLQWEIIKHAKDKSYKVYDLWGVCPKDAKKHPWYGLSLFKYGFSDDVVQFMHAKDIVLNPLGHLTRLYEKIESTKWRY